MLGLKKEFPAYSCADLKKHGREDLESGSYFIERKGKKESTKQYCDMTTDEGGWTLFFTYRHHPYEMTMIEKGENLPVD